MRARVRSVVLLSILALLAPMRAWSRSPAEILAAAPAADWRPLDPDLVLVMELAGKTALIELAPRFAPKHVENIRRLARAHFFDGLAVVRVQDNYVTQWGDPNGEDAAHARPLGDAATHLPAEFWTRYRGLPLAKLPDPDGWAPLTGFVDGFPLAADPARDRAWIPHCYGVVGAGRDLAVDSSTGAELYVVIGQSPRALDRNMTMVGRVLSGMDTLTALPRGSGTMGFYSQNEQRPPITSVRLLSDLPDHPKLEVLKTPSSTWQALVAERRHPSNPFFVTKADFTNVCNLTVPVRQVPNKD